MLVRHRHRADPGNIRADRFKRAFNRLSRQARVHQDGRGAAGNIGAVAGGSGKQGTENHRACPFWLSFITSRQCQLYLCFSAITTPASKKALKDAGFFRARPKKSLTRPLPDVIIFEARKSLCLRQQVPQRGLMGSPAGRGASVIRHSLYVMFRCPCANRTGALSIQPGRR